MSGRIGNGMPIRKFEKEDIKPLAEIVRATGVFREEEIDVAVELMDIAANDKEQKDYFLFSYVDEDRYCAGILLRWTYTNDAKNI